MENDVEKNGITLGDLMKAVAKKIWIVLIATLVVAIAGGLFVKLWVNPSRMEYSLEFTLVYPGSGQLKYPDGAPFYYQDIISAEMLERAKATDEKLSSVDVSGLLAHDKISITANGAGSFTLKAAQSSFENYAVASDFLKTVASMPLELVKERAAKTDFHLSESVYKSAYSFQDKIALLTSQRSRMITQYNSWISLFDNGFLVKGKPLKNYRAEMEVIFSDSLREELLKDLNAYGYVLPEQLESRIAALRYERAINDAKIRELKSALAAGGDATVPGKDFESLSYMLADLTVRNVEIDYALDALTEENIAAFEQIVDREYERLELAANAIQSVAAALYEQEARVNFVSTRVNVGGGMSAMVVACGAGVVTFLLASGIICLVVFSKKATKSEKPRKEETAE